MHLLVKTNTHYRSFSRNYSHISEKTVIKKLTLKKTSKEDSLPSNTKKRQINWLFMKCCVTVFVYSLFIYNNNNINFFIAASYIIYLDISRYTQTSASCLLGASIFSSINYTVTYIYIIIFCFKMVQIYAVNLYIRSSINNNNNIILLSDMYIFCAFCIYVCVYVCMRACVGECVCAFL